jgi:hypothetical protein
MIKPLSPVPLLYRRWNVVFGFHVPQYPQGHQATDYWRWIKSHGAYPVQYQVRYGCVSEGGCEHLCMLLPQSSLGERTAAGPGARSRSGVSSPLRGFADAWQLLGTH